jgi:hypothetical protein
VDLARGRIDYAPNLAGGIGPGFDDGGDTADMPGTASAAGESATQHVSVFRDGRALDTTDNSTSAGYVTVSANPTEASGTFVIPKFTCSGAEDFDLSIQLEGSDGSAAVGFLGVTCKKKGAAPSFQGFTCAGTSGPCGGTPIAAAAGNTITMTDSLTASGASAEVDDVTSGAVDSTTGTGSSSNSNVNFIDQRGTAKIPTFSKATFTNCTVDGTPISANQPFDENMTSKSGVTQVKTGKLTSNGKGFTTQFKNS